MKAPNLQNLNVGQKRHVVIVFFEVNKGVEYRGQNRASLTVATLKNGEKKYGFFDKLEDYHDLFKLNKFRLVNAKQSGQYRDEINSIGNNARTGNPNYTTIIDLEDVIDLRMVVAGEKEDVEVDIPGYAEYLKEAPIPA